MGINKTKRLGRYINGLRWFKIKSYEIRTIEFIFSYFRERQ